MNLKHLSPELKKQLAHRQQALREALAEKGFDPEDAFGSSEETAAVLLFSEFVASSLTASPELFMDLRDSGDLDQRYEDDELSRRVRSRLPGEYDEKALRESISEFRQREMVRIAWRDLSGKAFLDETLRDLSALADACITTVIDALYGFFSLTMGVPEDNYGNKQGLIVLGMGKLGARELNFSSDVDLIFAYPGDGFVKGDPRGRTNEVFFTDLCRRFLRIFDSASTHLRIFRVDTRLRPYGSSGPLVMSTAAMEQYYQTQGREWERYAMIKARPVAGDLKAGYRLLEALNPFVYRRYLDYGAFDSFRDMKKRISLQVRDKRLKNNIKLGAGGIREVEFFGQIFQLIRGGVEPEFQERGILKVLDILQERSCITSETRDGLVQAYVFLRTLENRLQEFADLQTHDLPEKSDDRLRLSLSMGFDGWPFLVEQLQKHMKTVHGHFNQLLYVEEEHHDKLTEDLKCLWATLNDPQSGNVMIVLAGVEDPERVIQLMKSMEEHPNTKKLTSNGRRRLDRLVPHMVKAALSQPDATTVLNRLVDLILAIERRTCYLSLLLENQGVLDTLALLAGKSPWIITFLSNHPALLDELLDPATLFSPPDKDLLERELDRRMRQIPDSDFEFQLEELCLFKNISTLRVAAADVSGDYPLMKVSDHLTFTAEVILDKIIEISWKAMTRKYGLPSGVKAGTKGFPGFSAIAYGKFGGIELGYKSDLDLVFIYSADQGVTQKKEKHLENSLFYTQLGQRIIRALSLHTSAGTLYETDMRLRPSGQAGMIVSHIDGFRDYMKNQAWTWEHQAIVRARPVSGDPKLQEQFNEIRRQILMQQRDPQTLQKEVSDMRLRMKKQHHAPEPGIFDLKQDSGGIIDIEFLVQYLVLNYSNERPSLTRWTDNVRLIETLSEERFLSQDQADKLKYAYLTMRKAIHRLNLQEKEQKTEENDFFEIKNNVIEIYEAYLPGTG